MLLIYTPKITNRHRYIFNVFFNEIYQLDYQVTDDIEFYSSYNSGKINYSKSPISDNEFFIESHSLLDERGINEQLIEVSVFDELPIFFQTSSSSSFPFDVFAGSFYLITRYEEYLPHIKDEYGRFKASESLAFNSNFLEKPLVNIWAKYLLSELKRMFSFIDFIKSEFRFISTIDIDAAYKFKHKGFVRTCANMFKYFYNRELDMLSLMLLVFFGRRKDPYDTYSLQFNLQKKYGVKVIYFVLIADYGVNDKNISYTNRSFQLLIKRLADVAEVAVHPSFASSIDEEKMIVEINRLEKILKREVKSSRQHFLQLSLPKTYRNLVRYGVQSDYSMGYASDLGFRASISTPYTFYDLETENVLPIKVHPFAVMDATLMYYLKLNPDQSLDRVRKLISEVKKIDGEFICVWHNETFSDFGDWKGWKQMYEKMLKSLNF